MVANGQSLRRTSQAEMDAAGFSETLLCINQTARDHIQEECDLN
jgi:hypothetical protein